MAKVGRPLTYDKNYHPKKVVEYCAQGYTNNMCAAEFDIDEVTFYAWVKKYPEFSQSVKRGKLKRELFFTNKGLSMVDMPSQGVNTAAWIWLTKNCCGWSDKIQHTMSDDCEDVET